MALVSYTAKVRNKLRAWAVLSDRVGMLTELISAIEEMDERLKNDPEAWGDPVHDYHGAQLTQYYRYGRILFVDYTVHIDGTPVFVVNVELTPGTALSDAIA